MERIKEFINKHRIYFFGYAVTVVTYFSRYSHEVKEIAETAGLFYLAIFSCIVGLVSWCYPIARVINAFCN